MRFYNFQACFLMACVDRYTREVLTEPEEFSCIAFTEEGCSHEVATGKQKDALFEMDLMRSGRFFFVDFIKQHPERFEARLKGHSWFIDTALISFTPLHPLIEKV